MMPNLSSSEPSNELEQLRAQVAALKQSNSTLSATLESARDLIAALDLKFRFIAFNTAYKTEFERNYNTQIQPGMSLMDALANLPAEQVRAAEVWGRALAGEEFTIVRTFDDEHGKQKHYEFTFSPILGADQIQIGATHVVRDITNRRRTEAALQKARDELEMRVAERTAELVSLNRQLQAELDDRTQIEQALRVSQDRFAGILEIASDAIIALNAQQQITLFNQGAERVFGYSAAEVIGQPLDILLPSRYISAHREHVTGFGSRHQHRARRMGERQEIYGQRKDGSEFPAEASISKLEVGGEAIFTVILRDISERRRVEDALSRLSRQNELILSSVGEGICGIDLEGNITFVNPSAARLLGYSIADLTGQPLAIILPTTRPDNSPYPFADSPTYRAMQDGNVYLISDESFERRDGTRFSVEYTSTPIVENGIIVGAVVTFRDVTDRRIVEKMKDEFISVVSHELRTPLTSIHGSLGMLTSGLIAAESEKGKRLLHIAVESTDRLVRLINDILDIERIESGKVTMMKEVCNVDELIEEAVNGVQAIADRTNLTLSPSSVSAQIWADFDRIIQILTNLLSNAIKFSPADSTISVSAEIDSTGSDVLFKVIDRGRGIPADKLDTIFERFQQVDASDSRNQDGTGLGLAICRSIVQQHAGRIWVDSTLGEGSTFTFSLPLYRAEEPTVSNDDPPIVMVCDDDSAIRTLLRTMLEQRGYRTLTVASGREAVEQAIACRPDVLVLDLLMPGMNGWDVMASLKENDETKDLPIIICSVTSPAQSNFPSKGFINWLGKPIDEMSLIQSLRQALTRSSQRSRILIVEDDTRRARNWLPLFQHEGLDTVYATTAHDAIQLSQQSHPDLIILDLELPTGDGYTVVDWLRQHSTLYSVPLVIYSAKELDDTQETNLRLNSTDFLIKGQITPQEFEHRVMELLHSMTRRREDPDKITP